MKHLYHLDITDHATYPRNFGIPEQVDFSSSSYNPSCGDQVRFAGTVLDGVVKQGWFEGKGCSLSLAMASKLTEYIVGKSVDELLLCDQSLVINLLGMDLGPRRMLCGLLPIQALQEGLKKL